MLCPAVAIERQRVLTVFIVQDEQGSEEFDKSHEAEGEVSPHSVRARTHERISSHPGEIYE